MLGMLFLVMVQASPQGLPASAAGKSSEPSIVTLFLFTRARAYYDGAKARHCTGDRKVQAEALNGRFEQNAARLTAQFGRQFMELPRSAQSGPVIDPRCKYWIPVGYDNALDELERELAKEKIP